MTYFISSNKFVPIQIFIDERSFNMKFDFFAIYKSIYYFRTLDNEDKTNSFIVFCILLISENSLVSILRFLILMIFITVS